MRPLPVTVALALVSLSACTYDTNCTPTTTTARRADKVNVGVLSRSAVVEARLTTRTGKPLDDRDLSFEVLDDGASVYTAEGSTDGTGTARVDLKRADPNAVLAIVRADAFRASFAGDGTYCGSSGRAGFHAVRG
jgi:hypothetical protein